MAIFEQNLPHLFLIVLRTFHDTVVAYSSVVRVFVFFIFFLFIVFSTFPFFASSLVLFCFSVVETRVHAAFFRPVVFAIFFFF